MLHWLPSTSEGIGKLLFSQVHACSHSGGGLPHLHLIILPLIPCPFWGWGTPSPSPILPLVPCPFWGWGVPSAWSNDVPSRGYPIQCQWEEVPQSRPDRSTPIQSWWGCPDPVLMGVPWSSPDVGYPDPVLMGGSLIQSWWGGVHWSSPEWEGVTLIQSWCGVPWPGQDVVVWCF